MTPNDLFQQGQLRDAIDAQLAEVKANPADKARRMFLYELLLFSGDLDRAEKHLDLIEIDEPGVMAAVQLYKTSLAAERARRRALAGGERPAFLGEVPGHAEKRIEALAHSAGGSAAEASAALEQANTSAPEVRGLLNGRPVREVRDGDDLFGTILEVLGSNGQYCWVPLEQVNTLTVSEPKRPLDMFFVPAHLVLEDGSSGDVMLPGLYPDSHAQEDDQLRLGRAADWVGAEGEPVRGVGGRLLMHSEGHLPLVNVRELIIAEG